MELARIAQDMQNLMPSRTARHGTARPQPADILDQNGVSKNSSGYAESHAITHGTARPQPADILDQNAVIKNNSGYAESHGTA
jgi:hypothetical protein